MTSAITIILVLVLCSLCAASGYLLGKQHEHQRWIPLIGERNDLIARLKLSRENQMKLESGIRSEPTKLKLVTRARS